MHRSDGRLEYSLFLGMCTAGVAWWRLVRETEDGLVEAGEGEREYIFFSLEQTTRHKILSVVNGKERIRC